MRVVCSCGILIASWFCKVTESTVLLRWVLFRLDGRLEKGELVSNPLNGLSIADSLTEKMSLCLSLTEPFPAPFIEPLYDLITMLWLLFACSVVVRGKWPPIVAPPLVEKGDCRT